MPLVYYSSQRVTSPAPFPMDVGGTTAAAVNAIGGLLSEAGWIQGPYPGGSYATASFSFPFSIVGWEGLGISLCEIDALWFQAVTGSGPATLSGGVGSVPVVLNGDGSVNEPASMAALAAGVELFTQWNAVVVGTYYLNLTAKNPGPAANASTMGYNGAQCVLESGPIGGAWSWLSQTNPSGSQVALTLIAGGASGAFVENLQIVMTFPGPPAGPQPTYTWILGAKARWQFWANPYSLAFWVDPTDNIDEAGDPYTYQSFFFAGVPRNCQVTYGAVPGGGISQAFAHWDPAQTLVANYNPGVAELNGNFYHPGPGSLNCSIAAPVANGYEIDGKAAVDPIPSGQVGLPIIIPARLGLPFPGGYGGAITTYVVGWLYDSMVATAQYPLGTTIAYDGHVWVALLAQAGATLFLCLPASESAEIPLSRTGWTAYSTNNYSGYPPSNMIDGSSSTFMAAADATSPFDIWFDMGSAQTFDAISYQRRQDQLDGAGHVQLFISNDGSTWTGPVFDTTWTDDQGGSAGAAIVQTFTAQTARWIKLHILANAAGDRAYASCAEFYAVDTVAPGAIVTGPYAVVPWTDETGTGGAPGGGGSGAIGNYAL